MTNTANFTQQSVTGTPTADTVWPCLAYTDARGAIRFLLDTLGFVASEIYGEGDRVDHAALHWPYGGGVMLGSAGRESPLDQHADKGTVYLVLSDEKAVDALYERVLASADDEDAARRASVTIELRDEDYGSHGFTCRDPQGVYWSIGTYRPSRV
ncbi:VOC family protein [Rhodococcus sp. CH91]|uniref:VOC family protein n=1 Tax=Rhodococcus sp. CH91 TaxID=2910256 RepID=UPI001F4B7CE1|nr:VOC family protein [Rhodococcus sp. CH91]